MNKKNKIIIFLLFLSLGFLGSIAIFFSSRNVSQHRSPPLPRSDIPKNNQRPNSKDEQLTSYFLVTFISMGFLIWSNLARPFKDKLDMIAKRIIPRSLDYDYRKPTTSPKRQHYYLILIKTILEIIVYEKNVNLINKKPPVLNFDLQRFLDQFLLGSQVGKNEARREAQTEIMEYLKKKKQRILIESFIRFTVSHLFAFLLNFILNFFPHGIQTWKRLKWNSLWKMIPNLQYKYERIIAYFLFFFPLGEYFIRYFFGYHFCNDPECIYQKNVLSYYHLVRKFFDSSNIRFPSRAFYPVKIFLKKNKIDIDHRNLDAKIYPLEKDFDNPQGIIDQGKQFRTKSCRKFINDMGKLLDPNNQFEQEIFDKVQKFVNNEE